MVQTVEPAKQQDHSVIRQLLSTAVRVPHVAVLTLHSKNSCSSNNNGNNKSKNICNNNEEKFSVKNSSISVELIQPEEKNISDLSDIELSAGSELFPEIGLSLPDLQDIDDMVTTETCPSPPDYSSAVLNSSEAESVMYSFPASEVVVSSSPDGREDNSVSLSMTSPGTREAASPMQICSSDSEAASSPPPVQHAFPSPQQSLPTKTSTTIRTLLNQPPLNQVRSGYPAALSQSSVDQPGPSSEMMIPATLDPGPAIPLSVLALGDHESAPMAQMILKQMDEQNPPQSSSAPSSDEEDYAEPEPARPARRRWVKAAPDAAVPPSRKKERKLSSVSSEQDLDPDYDDLDSECGDDSEKVEKRRLNNRVAAQRCRQRKRQYHQSLTKEIQFWECSNTSLKYDIHTLQKELQELQQVLQEHQAKCSVDPADLAAAANKRAPEEGKKPKRKSKRRSRTPKRRR